MGTERNATERSGLTGETYAQALAWICEHGLATGLIPDAPSTPQRLLEAAVLRALARPTPRLGTLTEDGTLYGIAGVRPDPDGLALWSKSDLAAALLARILPAQSPRGIVGIPGARLTGTSRTARQEEHQLDSLDGGHVTVKGRRGALFQAERLLVQAGLEPLWTRSAPSAEERASWLQLTGDLASAATEWSRALRRAGSYRERTPDWTNHSPRPEEITGPIGAESPRHITHAAPASTRRTGVIQVVSTPRKGGQGSTTVSTLLAAALAQAGARVALVADPLNLPRLTDEPRPTDWQPAAGLPLAPGSVEVLTPESGVTTEHVQGARERAEIVVVDAGLFCRADVRPDLTLALARYQPQLWERIKVTDRRPDHIRMRAWLQTKLEDFETRTFRQPEPDEEQSLLALLDVRFLMHVIDRLDDGDAQVYDTEETEDIEEFWDTDSPDLELGGRGDILPAEDRAPLDDWRQDFLDFIESEGARRHPDLWLQVRGQWAARNKHRNLQRLDVYDHDVDEEVHHYRRFLDRINIEGSRTWGAELWPADDTVWMKQWLHQWLDDSFHDFVEADVLTPATAVDGLLTLLDVHFAQFARAMADYQDAGTTTNISTVFDDDITDEWWWNARYDRHEIDPMPKEDEGPLDQWRAEFLDAIDLHGATHQPELWAEVRTQWAERNRERNLASLAPLEPSPEERDQMRSRFLAQISPIAARAWGALWEPALSQWRGGEREPDLRDFDHLIDRETIPRDPHLVANDLLETIPTPSRPTALVVSQAPRQIDPDQLTAVRSHIQDDGLLGLIPVRQLRALSALWHEPATALRPDGPAADILKDLARTAHHALTNRSANPSEGTP
ncbi:hypothetical protein [Streptomyces sp. NPDC015125]|uniref:hypothetical protein n=1 Tax=Streptomyces sp. NPDC015125 TaxID=3364938 RepID=UPI0036FC9F02